MKLALIVFVAIIFVDSAMSASQRQYNDFDNEIQVPDSNKSKFHWILNIFRSFFLFRILFVKIFTFLFPIYLDLIEMNVEIKEVFQHTCIACCKLFKLM